MIVSVMLKGAEKLERIEGVDKILIDVEGNVSIWRYSLGSEGNRFIASKDYSDVEILQGEDTSLLSEDAKEAFARFENRKKIQ